ncbi:unnamed protein product [Fraxinus pennsylvanica]|uniref:Uncharacterized protein n=1 Tax=Fraxinus pennsylvanica TaxID=56036 RepID=A0AAD2AEH6_9LAMI|nr:unnamed protein product [Fraxinus pennsylvanica]
MVVGESMVKRWDIAEKGTAWAKRKKVATRAALGGKGWREVKEGDLVKGLKSKDATRRNGAGGGKKAVTCPSVWLVLHAVRQQSLQLFTNYDDSPGPLSSFLLTRMGPNPHKVGGTEEVN